MTRAPLPRLADCSLCADPIRFVRMIGTGRHMPVNPTPTPQDEKPGQVAARLVNGRLEGFVIGRDNLPGPMETFRFRPHYATCEGARTLRAEQSPPPDPHPELF